jgi:hypothetical protein
VTDEYGHDTVYAEAFVGDYYGSQPCGGFYQGFSHEYSILIEITCGVDYQQASGYSTAQGGGGYNYTNNSLHTEATLDCSVVISMVIYCPLIPGPILEEYVGESVQVNSCSLTAKFSGGFTIGNNLNFPVNNSYCGGNTLGIFTCPAAWIGNTEISGSVSDDAALWTVHQSVTGRVLKIVGSGPLQDMVVNVPDDYIHPDYIQNPAGQKQVFWLDAPGWQTSEGGQAVTSLYMVKNFTSELRKNALSCSVTWHLKLVVNEGNLVDSDIGLGHLSTVF